MLARTFLSADIDSLFCREHVEKFVGRSLWKYDRERKEAEKLKR